MRARRRACSSDSRRSSPNPSRVAARARRAGGSPAPHVPSSSRWPAASASSRGIRQRSVPASMLPVSHHRRTCPAMRVRRSTDGMSRPDASSRPGRWGRSASDTGILLAARPQACTVHCSRFRAGSEKCPVTTRIPHARRSRSDTSTAALRFGCDLHIFACRDGCHSISGRVRSDLPDPGPGPIPGARKPVCTSGNEEPPESGSERLAKLPIGVTAQYRRRPEPESPVPTPAPERKPLRANISEKTRPREGRRSLRMEAKRDKPSCFLHAVIRTEPSPRGT